MVSGKSTAASAISDVMNRRPLRALAVLALLLGAGCTAPAPPDATSLPAAARETYEIAEAGDPVAQTVLGNMFEAGVFGAPDYRAAALWYDRAVKQGDPLAAFYLAGLFERGQGVRQDLLSAANLYRRAAKAGNAAAAFKLGFLYEKGLGVEQDFAEARRWYDSAQSGWVMQGLAPMQPAYLTADASPAEVEALLDAARASQPNLSALAVAQAAPPPGELPQFNVPEIPSTAPAAAPTAAPEPAPQAAPAPAPAEVEVAAANDGAALDFARGFHVHLASEKSVEAAMADWDDLRARFPDLLAGLTPALATLDLGSAGTYYQLLAGPMGGEADADILCARLQPQGQYCTPILPQG